MRNINIAHDFFYGDFNEYRTFNNVSYSNNLFYSYYTVIGAVVKAKDGSNILLVSESSMTPTTGRHIGNLISACPFNHLRVPMRYGKHSFSLDDCINDIITILDNYTAEKLTRKANREGFVESYEQLLYINEYIKDIDPDIIAKYAPLFDLINHSKELKELRAKLKEKAKQDELKAKAELDKLLNTYDYLDLVQFAFDIHKAKIVFNDYQKDREMSARVKKVLNPNNDLSFVWIDEDENKVKTSKSIQMSMDIVKTGLKLWKHNKIKHGYQVGCYTVLEVRKDYVQIGCHKIPMDNIKALYEKIFETKAETIKELQVA